MHLSWHMKYRAVLNFVNTADFNLKNELLLLSEPILPLVLSRNEISSKATFRKWEKPVDRMFSI